jgi:hypothetical protein
MRSSWSDSDYHVKQEMYESLRKKGKLLSKREMRFIRQL